MLGQHTKCDLSAGHGKLDINALESQVEKHFYSLVNNVLTQTSEIRDNSLTIEDRKRQVLSVVSHGANRLLQLSKDIAETADLLHTLYNREDRKIDIISQD